MKKNTKAAFLSVEAAVFLPIFIIAVLCIAYFMKYTAAQETVIHDIAEESRLASMYSAAELTLPVATEKRIEADSDDVESYCTDIFLPYYSDGEMDKLCRITVSYDVNIHLPLQLYNGFHDKRTVVFRPFVGKKYIPPVDDGDRMVIVFPRYGIRYHTENCRYIESDSVIVRIRRKEAIAKGYTPCLVCGGGD